MNIAKPCEQCKHVDHVPGTRLRCQHPQLEYSMLVALLREPGGVCGPSGGLWEQKAVDPIKELLG